MSFSGLNQKGNFTVLYMICVIHTECRKEQQNILMRQYRNQIGKEKMVNGIQQSTGPKGYINAKGMKEKEKLVD